MATITSAPRAPRLHYGWVVAGLTFVALLIAAGIRSAGGVLMVPLEQEFGWSRASISFAVSVALMLYGLIGPFAAGMMDRFGLRRTLAAAMVLLALGMGPTVLATDAWQLSILWGLGTGLDAGMAAMIVSAVVANRWFHSHRGLVLGLLTGGTAAGQLLFLPALAALVHTAGWRTAVLAASGVALLMAPVLLLFMRDDPADVGLRPYGLPADAPAPVRRPRADFVRGALTALGEAVASRDFWLLSVSFFICGGTTLGLIGTHFIPACIDHGLPENTAAGVMAAMGALNVIGTVASGWLTDRVDSRYLLCAYYATRAVSLLFLPVALTWGLSGLAVFGLFYGLEWIATVPPTVRLLGQIFGTQRAAVMYGWAVVMHQLGSAAAAYGGGLAHTYAGSYQGGFMLGGALCAVAAVLVLRVGRPRRAPPHRLATAGP